MRGKQLECPGNPTTLILDAYMTIIHNDVSVAMLAQAQDAAGSELHFPLARDSGRHGQRQ